MHQAPAPDLPASEHHLQTRAAHAGCRIDPETGALTPPIHLATTYERDESGEYGRGYVYSRWDNPTRHLFEQTLADLEGGTAAAAFSSGMAAAMAMLQSLRPGDHVILGDDVYHGVRGLFRTTFSDWGLTFSEVDQTNLDAVRNALRPETKLIWAETPSNPLLKITDIAALAGIAHEAGALLAVDGTWTTPLLQRPFDFGADIVWHSATKYLGGHSDVLCGIVVTKEENTLFERVRNVQMGAGPVAAPFDCWLVLRGMRSLAARLRVHCENTRQLADFLQNHPRVRRVHYPGLTGHPGHEIAKRQMADFGGMLSFEVDGSEQDALAVAAKCRLFTRATSLGGTESLIEHRASIESKPTPTPVTLLRVSVGLEHPDDLIADLEHALS